MSSSIQDVSQARSGPLAQASRQHGAKQTGNYRGEDVVVVASNRVSLRTLAADAVEELAIHVGQEEEGEEELDKRRIERLHDPRETAKGAEEERLHKGSPLDSDRQGKLPKILSQLLSSKPKNAGDLLKQLREHYESPSHQQMALEWMLENLGGRDPGLRRMIEEARDLNLRDNREAIDAGMAPIDEAAAQYGGEAQDRDSAFHSLYRETVVAGGSLDDLHRAILEKFGADGFLQGVGFLLRAAGGDLATLGESPDAAAVRETVDNIYGLEGLNTISKSCTAMMDRLDRFRQISRGVPPGDVYGPNGRRRQAGPQVVAQARELLRGLLPLMGKSWVTPADFASLAASVDAMDEPLSISFLRELKDLVRDIPEKLFPAPPDKNREHLVDAARDAYEEASANEVED